MFEWKLWCFSALTEPHIDIRHCNQWSPYRRQTNMSSQTHTSPTYAFNGQLKSLASAVKVESLNRTQKWNSLHPQPPPSVSLSFNFYRRERCEHFKWTKWEENSINVILLKKHTDTVQTSDPKDETAANTARADTDESSFIEFPQHQRKNNHKKSC